MFPNEWANVGRKKDGTKFRENDHVQKFWKYRQNNECDVIYIAYANKSFQKFHKSYIFENTLTSIRKKKCPGACRDQK